MKNYRNQLDRFRDIAKRLVDEHSAELFTRANVSTGNARHISYDVYSSHLNVLGKELDEQAQQFITKHKASDANLKSDVWNTCKKYLDQFVKRNEPHD